MARVAPFVKPLDKWEGGQLFDFLNNLPLLAMLMLKQSSGILKVTDGEGMLKGSEQDARDIQKHALWLSSNVLSYAFLDKTKLNYHALVTWASSEASVPEFRIKNGSSFALEHELQKMLIPQLWDKLNSQQRNELLIKIDPHGAIKDKAAIVALSGVGAMSILSTAVALNGFAFYTTMSTTIALVASAFGTTLPFAIYTSAATTVGALSGPIGWRSWAQ
jgi:hypothetical protein